MNNHVLNDEKCDTTKLQLFVNLTSLYTVSVPCFEDLLENYKILNLKIGFKNTILCRIRKFLKLVIC